MAKVREGVSGRMCSLHQLVSGRVCSLYQFGVGGERLRTVWETEACYPWHPAGLVGYSGERQAETAIAFTTKARGLHCRQPRRTCCSRTAVGNRE